MINPLIQFKLYSSGWDNGMPCISDIHATGDTPTIAITEKYGLNFTLALAFDLKCKKHESDEEYSPVFTVVTDKIDFSGAVSKSTLNFFLLTNN